jgi:hypothetical protein
MFLRLRLGLFLSLSFSSSWCRGSFFNYVATNEREDSYGPADWGQVDCRDTDHCVSGLFVLLYCWLVLLGVEAADG